MFLHLWLQYLHKWLQSRYFFNLARPLNVTSQMWHNLKLFWWVILHFLLLSVYYLKPHGLSNYGTFIIWAGENSCVHTKPMVEFLFRCMVLFTQVTLIDFRMLGINLLLPSFFAGPKRGWPTWSFSILVHAITSLSHYKIVHAVTS